MKAAILIMLIASTAFGQDAATLQDARDLSELANRLNREMVPLGYEMVFLSTGYPTKGSPVDSVHVWLQWKVDVLDIDPQYAANLPLGWYVVVPVGATTGRRAAVAGIDAEGRQGPWSLWSEEYTPVDGGEGE